MTGAASKEGFANLRDAVTYGSWTICREEAAALLDLLAGNAWMALGCVRSYLDQDDLSDREKLLMIRAAIADASVREVPTTYNTYEDATNPPVSCNCGHLEWTVKKWGRVTHKHSCPVRTDTFCQTHPKICESEDGVAVSRNDDQAEVVGASSSELVSALRRILEIPPGSDDDGIEARAIARAALAADGSAEEPALNSAGDTERGCL